MQLRKRSSASIETSKEELVSFIKKRKINKKNEKVTSRLSKKDAALEPQEVTVKLEEESKKVLELKLMKCDDERSTAKSSRKNKNINKKHDQIQNITNGKSKESKGLEKLDQEDSETEKEIKTENSDDENISKVKKSTKKNKNSNKKHDQKQNITNGKSNESKGLEKLDQEDIETEKKIKPDKSNDEKISKVKKSSKKKNDTPVSPPSKYESLGCGPPAVPSTGKKYVGCHVSGAGGVWKCFANGELSNATSIALFLRSQRAWNAKPLDDETVKNWNKSINGFPPHLILPHGSYLMNLGSPKADVLSKSRQLFIDELQRCEKLGIPHFNFHPGSTLGEISREECCKLISESINIAHKQTSSVICVIENMSGQGSTVGGDFHEIRLMIQGVEDKSRVGVCIDTCHAHAAGYDLGSEKGFNQMVSDFEKIIGWQFLRALHVNDSKGKAGDHKDRHEIIGEGYIGKEGFERIMNYRRFDDIPLILETPFVSEEQYATEIKLLQSMVK